MYHFIKRHKLSVRTHDRCIQYCLNMNEITFEKIVVGNQLNKSKI